jgi:hypothetical protein
MANSGNCLSRNCKCDDPFRTTSQTGEPPVAAADTNRCQLASTGTTSEQQTMDKIRGESESQNKR